MCTPMALFPKDVESILRNKNLLILKIESTSFGKSAIGVHVSLHLLGKYKEKYIFAFTADNNLICLLILCRMVAEMPTRMS